MAMWAIWAEIMGKKQGLQLRSENLTKEVAVHKS